MFNMLFMLVNCIFLLWEQFDSARRGGESKSLEVFTALEKFHQILNDRGLIRLSPALPSLLFTHQPLALPSYEILS